MKSYTYLGKSNQITQKTVGELTYIEKHYEEKLVQYDVCWPLSRRDAELLSYQLFSKLAKDNCFVRIPHIYADYSSSQTLAIEEINAPTLTHLITTQADAAVPSVTSFTALLTLLHSLSQLRATDFSKSELALFEKQKEIAACMYHNKHRDAISVINDATWHFCLGDVSLNNLIFDGEFLYPIDFECAHPGYLGYDIGQLLGMADAYANLSQNARALRDNLFFAYASVSINTKHRSQIDVWRSRFFAYYQNSL